MYLPLYAFQDEDQETDITITDTVQNNNLLPLTESSTTAIAPPEYKDRKFGTGLKQKYNGSEFDYTVKKAPDNFFTRFLAKVRKFIHDLFNGKSTSRGNVPVIEAIARIIGIAIILAAAILIIISIVRGNTSWLFGKKPTAIYTGSEEAEDLMETDFSGLINRTENATDYRLAVRYYYLWLLQQLATRGFIKWNNDKTNTDYYYEIYDSRIRADFKYLSYVYDYIWYGEFELDNESYLKAKNAFRKTINTL
jgi:hypothetical protein